MRRLRTSAIWAFAFAVLFLGAPALHAQVTGTIRGSVTDPTGAAIPDATVKIENPATGFSVTVTTTADGSFTVPQLLPGTYTVTISKSGFKTFTQAGIELHAAQTFVVSAQLEVGQVSQTVEVTAPPLQIDTTTMQLGGQLAGEDVKNFPLLNRTWIQLQQSLPGVVAASDRFGNNFATNGNRSQFNNYLVNGIDANDLPLNTPLGGTALNPDAVQEVQIVTNTLNPEYGRNSGAILIAVTKSGTNNFHGTAFEFYRDTFLNARNFFSKVVPPFHQNQFGGTFGGPIWKNKMFFFFSYQGTRSRSGGAGNTPVFSAAQRQGNFTGITFPSGAASPIPLFGDSASPCPVAGGNPCPAGTSYSTLFSTGQIPTQDFNPISVKLVNQFVPLPNATSGNIPTFQFVTSNTDKPDQYSGRFDYNVTPNDNLFFYVFWQDDTTRNTLPFTGANLPGFPQRNTSAIKQFALSYNHIFRPNLLNELRLGYNRLNFDAVEPVNPVLPSDFGFQINPQNPKGAGVPVISITGLFTLGFTLNGPQPRIDDTGQFTDNLSYTTPRHAFKFGTTVLRGHVFNPFFFENSGTFSFGGGGPFSTGNPGLDFLLGFPDSYGQSSGNIINARAWEVYSYIQDQWKILPTLTMTYGAGWQVDTPLTDLYNNGVAINAFRPGQQSRVFPTAPVGLLFPGDPGITSSGYSTKLNNFAPRIGFAWNPRPKLSIRTGWGIYYDNSEEELTLQNLLAPPFALIDTGIGDVGGNPSFAAPFTDIRCIGLGNQPIPNCTPSGPQASIPNKYPFTPPQPGNTNVDFTFFEPFSLNVVDPRFNVQYAMNYNLTVQYQIRNSTIATLSYVGSQGRRLEGVVELNPYNPQVCLSTPGCPQNRAVEFIFPGVGTVADASIFGSIGQQGTFLTSNYNALQLTIEQAMWHGLYLRGAYTYSHALDFGSSFENSQGAIVPGDFRRSYGDSAYDARHRLVLQYLYRIPDWGFHVLPSRLTRGWTVSGITTFQTGFPITLTESDFRSLQCTPVISFYGCWDRPQVVAPVRLLGDPRHTTGNEWFDPSSFKRETLGTLGNAGRNFFHGPGINNWDISFWKDTAITESTNLQLRIDLFNAWNHAQFANPNGNVASSLFGHITGTRIAPRIVQLSASFSF